MATVGGFSRHKHLGELNQPLPNEETGTILTPEERKTLVLDNLLGDMDGFDFNYGLDLSDNYVEATGGTTARTLADWMAGDELPIPPVRGFWTDVGDGVNIHPLRDRVFVGDMVDAYTTYVQDASVGTWIKQDISQGLRYLEKTAQFGSLSSIGGIGGLFASRQSDNGQGVGDGVPIGISSWGFNNLVGIRSSWGGYFEARRIQDAGRAFGVEIDIANEGDEAAELYSYSSAATTMGVGIWLASGGDPVNTNPNTVYDSTAAIGIVSNDTKWRKGIVFAANAITGTDGSTGTGCAVEMAKGHELVWRYAGSDSSISAVIRADNTSATTQSRLVFALGSFRIKCIKEDLATEDDLLAIAVPALGAGQAMNRFSLTPTVTGGGLVTIAAAGVDTNIDFAITPKAAGVLKFGTHTADGGSPVTTGYITIKDSGGTVRKLAVIT